MKKIININLSGRVIPIEDSAYESLQRYIESLRRYFANEEGRDEIINDIESRVAELMNDKVRKGAAAITDADIEEIIASMGRIEDFEEVDAAEHTAGAGTATGSATAAAGATAQPKGRLYRNSSDKIIGGVCGGLANYLNIDPAIIRILFAIMIFGGGFGFLLYIVMWIFVPERSLASHIGKRFFRNPDDKIIAGVAGGLAAYFDRPAWVIRLIFAAPLVLNIVFAIFNGIFFAFERDIFPNFFIAPFTGTFCLVYIVLWIVLPEARSSFEKMEMRGEKVDVNRIRQNVQEGMGDLKNRMQSWGEEVKTSAENLGNRAKEFASTRGKEFSGEVAATVRPAARGLGHIIGILFKAFFIFVAGCMALSLFALLMILIFGGVAWWPINDFLWSSGWQKTLAWSVVLFFFTVPVIAFITWLVRRILHVRSRNHYLSWTFGSLWLIGLFAAIALGLSIANDLRSYEKVESDLAITQPAGGKLVVRVVEPDIRYTGDSRWFHPEDRGWDLNNDTMRYNNVKVRVVKSEDSLYHTTVFKYSAGSGVNDARNRATETRFTAFSQDSFLNVGSGLAIGRHSKFRGQGVILEIQVPVGKKIRFDESVTEAYNPWVVRRYEKRYSRYSRRQYKIDWDSDEYFEWEANTDYTMNDKGELYNPLKPVKKEKEDTEWNSEESSSTQDRSEGDNYNELQGRRKDSLNAVRREQQRLLDSVNKELRQTEQQMKGKTPQRRRKDGPEARTSSVSFPQISILI